jgi:formylglycine-generating enzyme required for sulfatase activity
VNTPDEWIGFLTKVGSYPPNPFGLFDLAGNVWEYCLDWYKEDFYQYCVDHGIIRNPVNLVGEEPPMDGSAKGAPWEPYTHDARVRRGGSYQYHESTLLTANRERMYPFEGNDHFGFRVVARSPSVVFNGKE